MKKSFKPFLSISLVFGLAGLVLILGLSPTIAAEPVKIGILGDFTGPSSMENPWEIKAAEFACEEFGWKVAGRPIKLIVEDSAGDPAPAVDKARKLVESDKVHAIIGPMMSHAAGAVSAYLTRSKTPHLFMEHGTLKELNLGGKNVFMHCGTLLGRGYPLGLYAYDVLKARTAVVIHDDFVAGEDFCQGTMDAFVHRGGKIIQRIRTPLSSMDYGSYLTSMKKADIVMFWFVPHHAMRFISQYNEYKLTMPLMEAGINTMSKISLREMGDKSLGIITCHSYDPGVNLPSVKDWIERYKKTYPNLSDKEGKDPTLFAQGPSVYMSMRIVLEAIKAAGGNTSKDVLANAIRNIKVNSPWGLVSFTKDGLGIGDTHIIKSVKERGEYLFRDVYTYKQIERRMPDNLKGAAPKM